MSADPVPRAPADAPSSPARPRLAVIVPVFKHSGLVREAVASLTRQSRFADVDVVLVDDGCPDPQTFTTLTAFCARWPNIHCVRQANGGLSAARNRGIAFALRRLPAAEGVYFLDADNLLAPYGIAAMQEALLLHPEADWFYPDIRMFGVRAFHDYSGDFNAYAASVVNLCEAGSLIRRRMIEAGLRFDEGMRLGYEDWDFWLSAVGRGFRGRHLPNLGLSYRKRAESMLADSTRSDTQIREYLRRKHEALFQVNAFVAREHDALPRFAVRLSDEASVEMASDLQRGGPRMDQQAFETRIWQAIREPAFVWAGQYLLSTTGRTLALLRGAGLTRWLCLEIERALAGHNFVSLTLAASDDDAIRVRRGHGFSPHCHLLAVSQKLLQAIALDEKDAWITELPIHGANYRVAALEIRLPPRAMAAETLKDVAVTDFVQFCLHLRCHALRGRPSNLVEEVFLGSRPLDAMAPRARAQFDGALLPPVAEAREGRVACVLPHCDFGGVEKVTFCLARELRRQGLRTSLILLGSDVAYRAHRALEAFDDIYLVDAGGRIAAWAGDSFLGTQLPRILDEAWARDFANVLTTFELVVSCHSAEIMGLFSGLRRRGVTTATYLHLFDKSRIGAACGHPMLALAYEHAIDLVLTCSEGMACEMASLGIPRDKILALPNAPSLEPDPHRAVAPRAPAGRPLRLLYLGRLDTQKGLDRLAEIIDALDPDPRFEIRVVGKAVLTDAHLTLSRHAHLEPPVYDDAGLSEIYRWADILLLPSRYEGLPLTVLEAMVHGVVPIVAACGAVAEAVESGVSGVVVPQERCVPGFLDHLRALAAAPERLEAMSRAAMARAAGRPWSVLAERLRARLGAVWAARARERAERAAQEREPG
ncbi:glycosyltransferase [Methylobacterium sp. WSM2598]|uniref:glycosyltransferase n=1 Tax=Methylobacterium sp. WSM2598 TaxID=398261 RepID=UPI000372623E|nr:glycosyltransferase [Methylobacterium sp. WSM2598]